MKYIKIIVALCAVLAFMPMFSLAQNPTMIDINAIVVDAENEPIEGAVVSNESTDAVTDAFGAFTLQVPENSLLRIRANGYKELVIMASENLKVITLESDADLVKLPFREVNKRDLVGGVSVINSIELLNKSYTSNPFDGLDSEIAGFNGNSIWGRQGYLLVVDGIPRDIDNVRTTEIEQISVLKGAGAVALYGTHAANGVIFITTKRGQMIDGQRVDVRVNSGMFQPKRYQEYLGSAEYMSLYREAWINDGNLPGELYFKQQDIDNTIAGTNPARYPENDFYSSQFLNNTFNRSDVTTEIYGGDENARYYTNIGYMRQGSLLNFGEGANSYDQRFSLKGNVDMDLTDWLSASVDAGAIFSSGRGPQSNFWEQAAIVQPNRYSPLLPINMIDMSNDYNRSVVENSDYKIGGTHVLGGSRLYPSNTFADIYAGGYNVAVDRRLMFNSNINADLGAITSGLFFRSKIGIDYSTSYNQGYRHQYRTFEPIWATVDGQDFIESLEVEGEDVKNNNQYVNSGWYRQLIYFSGQLDYKKSFNNRHNLFTMLVANGYQYSVSGEYHKTNNTNLGYYLGYNFLNKYYLDFNSSLMYSTKLAPGNRIELSPVLTLGWRVSDESFMQGVSAVNNLKLTATAGRIYSDTDIEEHYMYASRYNYRGTNWYSWAAEMGIDVTAALRGANENLESPYRDELNAGFEATLFDRFLDVEANYFSINYVGGIIQATTLFPSYLNTGWPASSFVPYVNYNEEKRTGYDFNVRLNPQIGNVDFTFGVIGTFYNTEIVKRADIYEYDYQEREGKPIDGVWGLQSAGFFADQADIDNSARQNAIGGSSEFLRPGDIKYVDQNGDGAIDNNDQVYLGRGGWYGAPNTLGVNLTAKWKNFTFYAQGVGRWGAYGIRNRTSDWVYGEGKYSDVVRNRWAYYTHPVTGEIVDTRATATYPRLTTQSGDNNFRNSDFWYINTDRFDISRIQLTYSLPESIIGNTFFRNVDVYVAGSGLLTIAAERKYLETNVGQAPQMRFYNVGISAAF